MSILIKELEERKSDYILVADVINVMANATNSAPDEVVKYLDAHNIDEHLTLLYMDESYIFEPYNGHILGLGNDANITYFKKADVMAFEPITKHGIFKDGSLYYINHLQRNSEDEYLTLDEVGVIISNEARINCDYNKIRDLARKKKITPCFYFSGFVCPLSKDALGELSISSSTNSNSQFKMMTGYFTYRLLVEQIIIQDDYLTVPYCEVGNEILIHRLLERQDDTNINYSNGLALFESKPHPFGGNDRDKFSCIEFDEIRFSKQELDSYIASIQSASDNHFIEHVKLVESDKVKQLESLKTKNDNLNARLNIARDTYKQNQNEIKELKKQLEQATADNAVLNEKLSTTETALAAAKNTTTAQPLDWQNMSEHIYPPELHLAMMVWQRIYVDNELKENHIPSHNGKFEVIAKKIGLNPKNTLGNRVAMLINTAHSKNDQTSLADQLRAIEQLHMPPKKEKTTS